MFNISELSNPHNPASSSAGIDDSEMSNLREELPSYSAAGPSRLHRHASRERQLHEFTLESTDRRPWIYLRLRSWAPSAKSLPVFLEDQDVSGRVDLDIRQPESIKSVEISIRGVVRTRNKETGFLHVSETLWNSSFGDPRSPSRSSRAKFAGRLQGTYSWPFSIVLPHEIRIEPKLARALRLNRIERLPPSLGGSDGNSVINYRLTVNIKRRGILRSDSSISTLIGYTPTIRPDPPSAARCRAYRDKIPIPGPELDASGWQILQDINLSGILFKQRSVDVTYTLALATPVGTFHLWYSPDYPAHSSFLVEFAYTHGTVIPCYLTVRTLDKQALDLLSNPSAPRITLRRKLTSRTVVVPSERAEFDTPHNEEAQPLAKAVWARWERRTNECSLMGELSVPLSCTPTFGFGEIKLEYFVDVYAPEPAGFQPSNEGVLGSTLVQVVSAYAEDCPRPRAYITHVHDASQRVAQADALGRHMPAFDRTNPSSDTGRPGTAPRPVTSSSIGGAALPQLDTFRQAQDLENVIRSVSPSSPTGRRRLNRRFSAL